MRENVQLEMEYRKFKDGSSQDETGPVIDTLKTKNYFEQIHRPKRKNVILAFFSFSVVVIVNPFLIPR